MVFTLWSYICDFQCNHLFKQTGHSLCRVMPSWCVLKNTPIQISNVCIVLALGLLVLVQNINY